MSNLTQRNIHILKIIVEEFLKTWEVLGSKALLKKYHLGVSSATVRNDMMLLEQLELIYQPYNSAGRLPTAKGLRAFISYLMQEMPDHFLSWRQWVMMGNIPHKKLEDYIYTITYELAKNTWEIAFFLLEAEGIMQVNGIWNFLDKNFKMLGESIFSIIRMLEDKHHFTQFITNLPLQTGVNVFLWEENIIQFLKDYTIIVREISIDGRIGYIWLIGSLKMNYSFNISAIRGII